MRRLREQNLSASMELARLQAENERYRAAAALLLNDVQQAGHEHVSEGLPAVGLVRRGQDRLLDPLCARQSSRAPLASWTPARLQHDLLTLHSGRCLTLVGHTLARRVGSCRGHPRKFAAESRRLGLQDPGVRCQAADATRLRRVAGCKCAPFAPLSPPLHLPPLAPHLPCLVSFRSREWPCAYRVPPVPPQLEGTSRIATCAATRPGCAQMMATNSCLWTRAGTTATIQPTRGRAAPASPPRKGLCSWFASTRPGASK